jgi:hypothetical protein
MREPMRGEEHEGTNEGRITRDNCIVLVLPLVSSAPGY